MSPTLMPLTGALIQVENWPTVRLAPSAASVRTGSVSPAGSGTFVRITYDVFRGISLNEHAGNATYEVGSSASIVTISVRLPWTIGPSSYPVVIAEIVVCAGSKLSATAG